MNQIKDPELYPMSSEKPLKRSEQKGNITYSFSKNHSGCWVDNEGRVQEQKPGDWWESSTIMWGEVMTA